MNDSVSESARRENADGSWVKIKKEHRKQAILNAAAIVFSEKGYDRAKLTDIADKLGMRGPSLYHYVSTKEDLFIQCAESMEQKVMDNLLQAQDVDGTPVERLEHLFYIQVLGQIKDFYPHYVPLFARANSTEPEIRSYLREVRKRHLAIFHGAAADAIASKELKNPDWELALRLAFGSLGSLHQWYRQDGKDTPEEIAQKVASSLMLMLRG